MRLSKYLLLVYSVILLSTCVSTTPQSDEYVLDRGFKLETTYMESQFQDTERKLKMNPRKYKNVKVYLAKQMTCANKKPGEANGCCTYNKTFGYAYIKMDYSFWSRANIKTKWAVYYHEMLHCAHKIHQVDDTIMDPHTRDLMVSVFSENGKTFRKKLDNSVKRILLHESGKH